VIYVLENTGMVLSFVAYGGIKKKYTCICGPGSSVGIETDYGLDGPGI
jgi:hypothetical protein